MRSQQKGKTVQKTRTSSMAAAQMGLLFALAICLSWLEGLFPTLIPVPGIKLGLSNIVTMYCVFLRGKRQAFLLAVLKAGFVLITRGVVAAVLSLGGGLLSVLVMTVLFALLREKASYITISVAGAVLHNIGQLLIAAYILQLGAVIWYYLPVLLLSGSVMGVLTAVLLRALLPLLERSRGDTGYKAKV